MGSDLWCRVLTSRGKKAYDEVLAQLLSWREFTVCHNIKTIAHLFLSSLLVPRPHLLHHASLFLS